MNVFSRRSLLGYSIFGAGAALAGGRASEAAGGATSGVGATSPYANDGAEKWVIDSNSAVADTDSGKVSGYIRNGIRIFQGIPYREILSPQGRWTRGAKVRPWTGTRSCRSQGPLSLQNTAQIEGSVAPGQDEVLLWRNDYQQLRPGEDCLRVNVWTPSTDNKKRQVLFYCHGGGFSAGGPLMASRYEAHNLAKYGDVVVVSMTHRLNALGFLDLTAYGPRYAESANLGMLDIIDALKWVRTNISNFGGDPDKVMIFGHSGGGAKVLALLAMPEAKGLFNRAVSQSPGPLPFSTPAQGAARTASFLKLVDVSPNKLDELHKLPVETLTRAAGAITAAAGKAQERFDLAGTVTDWQPVVDGRTVLYDPTLPTMSSDVPLMIGTALHENYNAVGHPEYAQMKELQAREIVRGYFGPVGDSIYDIYRGKFPKSSPYELSAMARATGRHRASSVKIAQRRATFNAAPTYNYWVQWQAANIFEGRAMSYHEIEMALVFLNSDAYPNATGGTAKARMLSLKMAGAWLAFAHTGNPNTRALPNWSPVTPKAMTTMVFDNTCRIDHGSDLAAIDKFWKDRYPKG